jgi:DNA invertase Pin-like site-specific DNA recombinase/transcriptional regulator with XRE-family HTH domain
MAIGLYLRVSTDEQRERQSIETQREFGQRYCDLHQLSVYEIFADDGVSGTVPIESRAAGRRVLEAARQGKFDQLLVFKLDRLGRDTRLILNAVAELEKYGVRIRSMTEEFDTGTATGRLMLTMLSGFASHEREVIRERSVAGTNRVAESGAWMGGIVPFGYRKAGEKRNGQLVVSEDPMPGMAMSEADVIRDVFRMAAVERKSCRVIAERLNSLRIPCAYVRDDRLMLRGKRKERTSGVWHPGRIRGLIINKTYMGVHEFGKRAASKRAIISRPVPAIVTEVWSDVEAFLRNPAPVLQQLQTRLESDAKGSDQTRKLVARLEGLLAQKATERSRVVGLYRRGRLTDADLDAQMDEIAKEQAALEAQIAELGGRITGGDSVGANICSAQALLAKLRKRLDEPISWELKRRLIEVLIAGVRVDTVETCGVKQAEITVTYRFSQPDQLMPLVLPQSYSTGRVIRIPTEPHSIGDHIRRRRLGLKMLQREVAEQIGVCEPSVFNWEANTSQPDFRYMPAIIRFLGYNPLPPAKSMGGRLVRQRPPSGSTGRNRRNALTLTPAPWRSGSAASGSRRAHSWREWITFSFRARHRGWTPAGRGKSADRVERESPAARFILLNTLRCTRLTARYLWKLKLAQYRARPDRRGGRSHATIV